MISCNMIGLHFVKNKCLLTIGHKVSSASAVCVDLHYNCLIIFIISKFCIQFLPFKLSISQVSLVNYKNNRTYQLILIPWYLLEAVAKNLCFLQFYMYREIKTTVVEYASHSIIISNYFSNSLNKYILHLL